MEELNFQELLDHFKSKGFQKGEQVILGYFGTVQTLLSLIFETPVNVKLIDQRSEDDVMVRVAQLVCGDTLVTYATSRIPKSRNQPEVLSDITAGTLGLGQIIVAHNLPNRRILLAVGRDPTAFWRTYHIEGPEIYLEINEHFPRKPFEEAGWLQPEVPRG